MLSEIERRDEELTGTGTVWSKRSLAHRGPGRREDKAEASRAKRSFSPT
jgi:hypothetical protein